MRSFNLAPIDPINADFYVSQDNGAINQDDLIVSFKNMPCPPTGYGPYSVEFLFAPNKTAQNTTFGQNRIDMFAVNSNGSSLPGTGGRNGSNATVENPTWANMAPLMGSLVGTFALPTGAEANTSKLIYINQLVCRKEMNFRFSITDDGGKAGTVFYRQSESSGLRIRYGC